MSLSQPSCIQQPPSICMLRQASKFSSGGSRQSRSCFSESALRRICVPLIGSLRRGPSGWTGGQFHTTHYFEGGAAHVCSIFQTFHFEAERSKASPHTLGTTPPLAAWKSLTVLGYSPLGTS